MCPGPTFLGPPPPGGRSEDLGAGMGAGCRAGCRCGGGRPRPGGPRGEAGEVDAGGRQPGRRARGSYTSQQVPATGREGQQRPLGVSEGEWQSLGSRVPGTDHPQPASPALHPSPRCVRDLQAPRPQPGRTDPTSARPTRRSAEQAHSDPRPHGARSPPALGPLHLPPATITRTLWSSKANGGQGRAVTHWTPGPGLAF